MNKNQAQSIQTRNKLISTAKIFFAHHGYIATSTEDIVRESNLTRGALYHHFKDKKELFYAVFETIELDILKHLEQAVPKTINSWEALFYRATAFMEICHSESVRRIILLDAPSLLGWGMWRITDAQYVFGSFKENLEEAQKDGFIKEDVPILSLTHLLFGAIREGAFAIAEAGNKDKVREEIFNCLKYFTTGLKA